MLSGTPRAHGLDRWIFVATAAWFILIVLVGFIPDSLIKIQMVKAGLRAPFPPILHAHAVLMGSYLLFLLSQTWLVATGRTSRHGAIGPVGGFLALALVVVGFILAPTMYHQVADGLRAAPPPARAPLQELLLHLDNILLLQIQAGLLFGLYVALGLGARSRDSGFHKRMMMFAPAMALGAAFARMTWLPHTIPASPLSIILYQLLALAPLFIWDIIRNRRLHQAYAVLAVTYLPVALASYLIWDRPWWHDTARAIMGV
ncbi:hypothetical protein G7076_01475 [Sphingomonas sp. HDW15A]|nr:hypothetical protein G7076_01475 [Sphingomonas sp. HDW15A]